MKIIVEIDPDSDEPTTIRSVASALLLLAGDDPQAVITSIHGALSTGAIEIVPPVVSTAPAAPAPQPVPPPVGAPAPPPVVPPAPGPGTGAAVDADGLPWDERIHGGDKKQNADGRWKKKRAVAAELVTQVEAELRAKSGPTGAAAAPPAPVVPQSLADPEAAYVAAGGTIPTPVAPVAAPAPTPAPPPATAPDSAFIDFMQKLNTDPTYMQKLITALPGLGLQTVVQLNQRPDLIPTAAAMIGLVL